MYTAVNFGEWIDSVKMDVKSKNISMDASICIGLHEYWTRNAEGRDDTLDSKRFNRRAVNVCAQNASSCYGRKGMEKTVRENVEKDMSHLLYIRAVMEGREPVSEDKVTEFTPLIDAITADPSRIMVSSKISDPTGLVSDCILSDLLNVTETSWKSLASFVECNYNNLTSGITANLYRRLMYDNISDGYIASSVYTSEDSDSYCGSKTLAMVTLAGVILYAGKKSKTPDEKILITLDNESLMRMAAIPDDLVPDPQDSVFITSDLSIAESEPSFVRNIVSSKYMKMSLMSEVVGTVGGQKVRKSSIVTTLRPDTDLMALSQIVDVIKMRSTAGNGIVIASEGEVDPEMEFCLKYGLNTDAFYKASFSDSNKIRIYGTTNTATREAVLDLLSVQMEQFGQCGTLNRTVCGVLRDQCERAGESQNAM